MAAIASTLKHNLVVVATKHTSSVTIQWYQLVNHQLLQQLYSVICVVVDTKHTIPCTLTTIINGFRLIIEEYECVRFFAV